MDFPYDFFHISRHWKEAADGGAADIPVFEDALEVILGEFYFQRGVRKMVQGEKMKRRIKEKRRAFLPMPWIYAVGFVIGILLPNLFWKELFTQRSVTSAYFLLCLTDINENTTELLQTAAWKWGVILCLTGFCGLTVFGVSVSWLVLLYLGFEFGSILTSSILQFGAQGGIFGLSLFLPQYALYIPAIWGICSISYQKSLTLWKNQPIFEKTLYGYWGKMLLFACLVAGGIYLEAFWNPVLVTKLIEHIKIFS